MLDAELTPGHDNLTDDQIREIEIDSFVEMLLALDERNLRVTIYTTGEFAGNEDIMPHHGSYLALAALNKNHEIAHHGMKTGELLSRMPYIEQLQLLENASMLIEKACNRDGREIRISGFRPQYFSQNGETFQALDNMSISYNTGFKAGISTLEGTLLEARPLLSKNYSFVAVPVSTHELNGRLVYLCDYSAKMELGLNGSQWLDLLVSDFDESERNGSPMVVLFHNFVAGEDKEYMAAYHGFIDYAQSKNASFVTSMDMAKSA
jgi:peptidoglycan/xylan/chitin deacetylase (PgdA/CDA1 family)